MPAPVSETFPVRDEQAGSTLAAVLRSYLPDHSWNQVRRLIEKRRVCIGGELCLDPARRLHEGDRVELLASSSPPPKRQEAISVRYLDTHVIVVEKPSGLATVRHPLDRQLSERRKALTPTLEDLVPGLLAQQEGRQTKASFPRPRVVHRLDKETSGLVVFARTVVAERGLGRQFRAHSVLRRYLAVIPGLLPSQRIVSRLVRDRGDGRRGSTPLAGVGKEAITQVEVVERLPGHTLLSCRLETGRTHQIRIHLAERRHPVCGEKVYHVQFGTPPLVHECDAPRLALHAADLGFEHPVTGVSLHWAMPLPPDLQAFVDRLRARAPGQTTPSEESRANQVD